MFRIIVAGSREFRNFEMLNEVLEGYIDKMNKDTITIVSGCAKGADELGEVFAGNHKLNLEKFPADWQKYGTEAGFIRNTQMARFATENGSHGVLFAFWNGKSNGTKDMINKAKLNDMEVHIIVYEEKGPEPNDQVLLFETDTLDMDYFKKLEEIKEPAEDFMNPPVDNSEEGSENE